MLEGWKGGANVGFALTRGNSETRIWPWRSPPTARPLHDHLALSHNSVYASNDAPARTPATTANAVQGGIRYDHEFHSPAVRLRGS